MSGILGINQHIAIDLGTVTTKVILRGKGIKVDEPTCIALNTQTGEVIAIGEEASRMMGRIPGGIEVIRPIENGVISEYDIIEKMLRYYISKVCGKARMFKPVVVISVPAIITNVEARAVVDAASAAGAREVYLICEPVAAAIGCGLDISRPHGIMVVDIGGGTTDIAVVTLNGVSATDSIRVAGNAFDEEIIKFIRRRCKLMIGVPTAQKIKIAIGAAPGTDRHNSMVVRGRNYVTGIPQGVEVTSAAVSGALTETIDKIVEAARAVLEKTPPELATDIKTDGILLSGGGSLLEGLDEYMAMRLGVPVVRSKVPSDAVVLGAAAVLEHLDMLTPGVKGYLTNMI